MNTIVWLRIEGKKNYGRWVAGAVSSFKSKPETSDREIAFKLNLEIPDSVFEEPIFEASLKLPENFKSFPDMTEIQKNISSELSKQTGFKVKVSLPELKGSE